MEPAPSAMPDEETRARLTSTDSDKSTENYDSHSPTLSFRDKTASSSLDESLIFHARGGNVQAVTDLLDARRRGESDLNVNHLGAETH